jgi:hypothetical protein
VEETEGWNEHISPCIGIELANLRLDIRIGKGHVFKTYGYGYGLGVTFVKKGIVYEKRCELKDIKIIFKFEGTRTDR